MATQERVEMMLTLDNAGEVYNYYSTGFAARGRTARVKLGIIRGMRMLALLLVALACVIALRRQAAMAGSGLNGA